METLTIVGARVDELRVMADPPRLPDGLRLRLFMTAAVLLGGFGAAAVGLSPAERAPATVAAQPDPVEAVERSVAETTTTSTTTTAAPPPAEIDDVYSVRVDEAIVYGTGATTGAPLDLVLDLYVPVDASGAERIAGQPAAVLVHGGGFTEGSRTDEGLPQLATELASHGIVTVSIDHRLAGDDPRLATSELAAYFGSLDPATLDEWLADAEVVGAAVEDVVLAASWLLDLDVDPDRLVLGGSSAGAVASLYAAHVGDDAGLDTPDVAAVISLWGGYTLTPGFADPIDPGDAPVWLVHGTDDLIVPYDYAPTVAFWAEMAGVETVLHGIDGAGHGFTEIDLWADETEAGEVLIDDLIAFLRDTT